MRIDNDAIWMWQVGDFAMWPVLFEATVNGVRMEGLCLVPWSDVGPNLDKVVGRKLEQAGAGDVVLLFVGVERRWPVVNKELDLFELF